MRRVTLVVGSAFASTGRRGRKSNIQWPKLEAFQEKMVE